MRFFELEANVLPNVFPDGWADNLKPNYRDIIVDALIFLQQRVPCLQTVHEDYKPACSTFYTCGASVFEAPRGFIKSIYTVSDADDCCDKVFYKPTNKSDLDCRLKEMISCGFAICVSGVKHSDGTYTYGEDDATASYPALPLPCFEFPSAQVDKPCRARHGYVAVNRGRIWMAPHMQSDEQAVIVWDGVKRDWENTDSLDETMWDRETLQAIEFYLEAEAARKFDCDINHYQTAMLSFNDKVRDLIWQCRKEGVIPKQENCFANC